MTQLTTRMLGDFGEILDGLMRAHGLEPDPQQIRRLAEKSGLDGDALLRSMATDHAEDLVCLSELTEELALTGAEKDALAMAYAFGGSPIYRRFRHGKEAACTS